MEKIARCVQTIKGVPIYLDVEDIDESDDVANDQGRQYNKDIGPESYAGGGVAGTTIAKGP
jgi:hypothetical protein